MKTMNFEQMEQVNGGKCDREAWVAFGSVVATIASAPSIFGLVIGAAFTSSSFYDYYKCICFFD